MIFDDIVGDFDYSDNYIEMYDYLNDNVFKTEVIAAVLLFFKNYFKRSSEEYNIEQLVKKIDNDSTEYPDIIKKVKKLKIICDKRKNDSFFSFKKEDKSNHYKITTPYKYLFYGILKNINIAPININDEKTIYSYAKNKSFITNLHNIFLEEEYLESLYISEKLFSVRTSLFSYTLLLKELDNKNIKRIMKLFLKETLSSKKLKYEKDTFIDLFQKIKRSNIIITKDAIISFIISVCKEEHLGDELSDLFFDLIDNIEQCLNYMVKIFIILLLKSFQYDIDSILNAIYNSDLYKKIVKTEKKKINDVEFNLSRKEIENYKYIAKLLINII